MPNPVSEEYWKETKLEFGRLDAVTKARYEARFQGLMNLRRSTNRLESVAQVAPNMQLATQSQDGQNLQLSVAGAKHDNENEELALPAHALQQFLESGGRLHRGVRAKAQFFVKWFSTVAGDKGLLPKTIKKPFKCQSLCEKRGPLIRRQLYTRLRKTLSKVVQESGGAEKCSNASVQLVLETLDVSGPEVVVQQVQFVLLLVALGNPYIQVYLHCNKDFELALPVTADSYTDCGIVCWRRLEHHEVNAFQPPDLDSPAGPLAHCTDDELAEKVVGPRPTHNTQIIVRRLQYVALNWNRNFIKGVVDGPLSELVVKVAKPNGPTQGASSKTGCKRDWNSVFSSSNDGQDSSDNEVTHAANSLQPIQNADSTAAPEADPHPDDLTDGVDIGHDSTAAPEADPHPDDVNDGTVIGNDFQFWPGFGPRIEEEIGDLLVIGSLVQKSEDIAEEAGNHESSAFDDFLDSDDDGCGEQEVKSPPLSPMPESPVPEPPTPEPIQWLPEAAEWFPEPATQAPGPSSSSEPATQAPVPSASSWETERAPLRRGEVPLATEEALEAAYGVSLNYHAYNGSYSVIQSHPAKTCPDYLVGTIFTLNGGLQAVCKAKDDSHGFRCRAFIYPGGRYSICIIIIIIICGHLQKTFEQENNKGWLVSQLFL